MTYLPTLPYLLSTPRQPLIHRDLSGIQFNERVLAEARTTKNPLLERIKFLAITSSNLDEFFMIRYASLDQSIRQAVLKKRGERHHLVCIRNSLLDMVATLTAKQGETLMLLASALGPKGLRWGTALGDTPAGKKVFDEQILPHLSPPEPWKPHRLTSLNNLAMAAVFENLWFRVSRSIPSIFVHTPDETKNECHLFFLDHLLATHLGPSFRLKGTPTLLRITRDGDIPMDLETEDPTDVPDKIKSGVGSRDRGRPVRLQYGDTASPAFISQCLTALRLSPRQVFPAPGTLGLSGLWTALGRLPDAFKKETSLWFPAFQPVLIKPLRLSEGMFAHLKKQDILLHHPYESFDGYVQFIRTACADPNVTSVQQTFYRTDALSPILEALKKAASSKRVRVVIELRARFDEMNNLRLAEDLRRAGVEVAFGLPRLKVHAKVALVTRQENGTEQLYTHLSTGNYNAVTARAYEDLALLTSNPEIGNDAQHFFDSVCHGEVPSGFKSLVPAPARLHRLLLQLIETETEAAHDGKPAYVFAKVNGLVDPRIVESLYQASQAGVQVDLVVRGACSLIPGVPGLSDNIRVVSLVDRFLEHSRIYYFAQANRMYLSSADWMPRNFFSRLELAFPVLDPQLFDTIRLKIIPAYLADTVKGRELTSQGTWRRRSSADTANPRFQKAEIPTFAHPFQAQTYFQDLTKPLFGHLKGTVIVKSDIVNATNGTWDAEK